MSDKLRVLVVDDEPRARNLIRKMLAGETSIQSITEAANGYEAIAIANAQPPDLIFLDIQMPELDGFEVLRRLHPRPAIVFVTAFDRYAVRAFEEHALDYLLKPFDRERLLESLHRAISLMDKGESSPANDKLNALLAYVDRLQHTYLQRITVKHNGRLHLLAAKDIDCIESCDNYARISSGSSAYLVREPLTKLEARLDPAIFIRVHRCSILNVEKLQHIEPVFHGEYSLVLASGKRLTLSRSYRDRFFERFGRGK